METGLSLGSNLGDRLAYLTEAKRRIGALRGVKILAQSPVYETEPVGVKPEYRELKFLNAVLIVTGPGTAYDWFERLREVEYQMGRERGLDQYAPRSIDIDVIYCGHERVQAGHLVLPHPRWSQRRFVVQPLADVRPNLQLPGSDRTVKEVLAVLPSEPAVTLLTREW